MTAYYVVEEPDDFFADDFGNDDAPVLQQLALAGPDVVDLFTEDPDDFFADDFGNDDAPIKHVPRAPLGLIVILS